MEMWELFLKGLAKTIEEFTVKMIEKGKQDKGTTYTGYTRSTSVRSGQPVSQPKTPVQAQDVEKLQQSIKEVLEKHPKGITMKNIAKELDVQWHFLRIPMRLLMAEDAIVKRGLDYLLPLKPDTAPQDISEIEEDVVEASRDEMDILEKDDLFFDRPEKSHRSIREKEEYQPKKKDIKEEKGSIPKSGAPRRRVVDPSQLEDKPKTEPIVTTMSIRERESLRYRIMTALRGRPEGLYLEKIEEVLGESAVVVTPILNELEQEAKVIKQQNGKFRLP